MKMKSNMVFAIMIIGVWAIAGTVSIALKSPVPIAAAAWFSLLAGVGYCITK